MLQSCLYRLELFLRASRLFRIRRFRLIVILPLDDPVLPFNLSDIQVCHMETVFLLYLLLDLFICSFTLGGGQIQLIHIDLNTDMVLGFGKCGQ